MDPNRYLDMRNTGEKPPVKESAPAARVRRQPAQRVNPTGKLCISGKRFFGQILIDHWVIRINGEQKKMKFGRGSVTLELPAGMYLVTAYTPYLGMHCNRASADIEVRAGEVTHISYRTVFDIFSKGIMRQSRAAIN